MINSENTDAILKDYDKWHQQRKCAGDPESPLVHPWYASVSRELPHCPGGRMLEVGCGRGGFAIWLSKQRPDFDITALDFSASAIAIAREKAAGENAAVTFVVGDAEALPFPDGAFDLVVSCECMEHVPHPPKMAQELARVLKPGGEILSDHAELSQRVAPGLAPLLADQAPFGHRGRGAAAGEFIFLLECAPLPAPRRPANRADGELQLPVAAAPPRGSGKTLHHAV